MQAANSCPKYAKKRAKMEPFDHCYYESMSSFACSDSNSRRTVGRDAAVLPFNPTRLSVLRACGLIAVSVLGGVFAACDPTPPPVIGSGGTVASGGAIGSGGTVASGGAVGSGGASGGAVGSGGTGSGGESLGGASGSGGSTNQAPSLLSETGLYLSDMTTLGPGVRPFEPGHELWSDAAEKKRWIALPEGEAIDTSDMDYWDYPIGTRLWKEF